MGALPTQPCRIAVAWMCAKHEPFLLMGPTVRKNRETIMRIQLLSGGLLVAALLQANASPAVAGAWCYLNETEHCGEVSFESCHFGTLGNGGYCYPNPNHRPEARAEPRDVAARSRPSDHLGYL